MYQFVLFSFEIKVFNFVSFSRFRHIVLYTVGGFNIVELKQLQFLFTKGQQKYTGKIIYNQGLTHVFWYNGYVPFSFYRSIMVCCIQAKQHAIHPIHTFQHRQLFNINLILLNDISNKNFCHLLNFLLYVVIQTKLQMNYYN